MAENTEIIRWPDRCPVSVKAIVSNDAWNIISPRYTNAMGLIDDQIIISKPNGDSSFENIVKYFEIIDSIIEKSDKKFILLSDYTFLNSSDPESRKYAIKYVKANAHRFYALIFCKVSTLMRLTISLSKKLATVNYNIQIYKDYKNGINNALKILKQEAVADSGIVTKDKSHKIIQDGLSVYINVIEPDIVHFKASGFLEEKHLPLVLTKQEEIIKELHNQFDGYYRIFDYTEILGSTWKARKAYTNDLKRIALKYNTKLSIVFGVSRQVKMTMRLFQQFLPMKIHYVKDFETGMNMIAKHKKNIHNKISKKKSKDAVYDELKDDVLEIIGNLNWELNESFDAEAYKDHPLSEIFDAFAIIKEDMDHLIEEKKQNELALKKALDKAHESDQLKSAFLANISHEIRTPLNAILGFSEILQYDEVDVDKKKEYLKIINSSGQHLLTLINDIIDLSKIESGQMRISTKVFNLNEFLDEIYDFHHSEIISLNKNLVLVIEKGLTSDKADINCDPVRLKQILFNLISNGIKYTEKGFVKISYAVVEDHIQFKVEDTGIGMSDRLLPNIFDRFVQADNKVTKKHGGTGLGLAITKALVELLKGSINVESTPGKGTLFTINLPYVPEEYVPFDYRSVGNTRISNWEGRKILVVEDDPSASNYIRTILEASRAEVFFADNGKDAIDLAINKKPDLILMDMQLPEINGFEATREIRKFNPITPIIAQTAFAMNDDKERCLQAGCTDYISKPYKKNNLLKIIEKYMNSD